MNTDLYPPGLADNAFAPYNQPESDPREDLFQEMCDFLEDHGSDFQSLHLDKGGWFYEKENDKTRYPLPNKYWLVAED